MYAGYPDYIIQCPFESNTAATSDHKSQELSGRNVHEDHPLLCFVHISGI